MGGGGGGSNNTTTIQKADPWGPTQDYLKAILPDMASMYQSGGFAGPESYLSATGRSSVADPSRATQQAEGAMARMARNDLNRTDPLISSARDAVSGVAQGGGQKFRDAAQLYRQSGDLNAMAGANGMLSNALDPAIGRGLQGRINSAGDASSLSGGPGSTYNDLMGFNSLGRKDNRILNRMQGSDVQSLSGRALDTVRGIQDQGGLSDAMAVRYNQASRGADLSSEMQAAQQALMGYADGSAQNPALEAAKRNALGSAVPAAVGQFAGAGLGNSSLAMDTVGRAATEATAGYEYDAANRMLDRGISAATGLGSLESALRGQNLGALDSLYGARASDQNRALEAAGLQQSARATDINRRLAAIDQQQNARVEDAGVQLSSAGAKQQAKAQDLARRLDASGMLAASRADDRGRSLQGAGLVTDANTREAAAQLAAGQGLGDLVSSQQQRQLQAAALAPSTYASQFAPAQMLGQVGAARGARNQAGLDEQVASYYNNAGSDLSNTQNYIQTLLGVGGVGGQSSSSQTAGGGTSFPQQALGAGLGGLGAYGALAMNPATAPFAVLGGLGAGLAGLF